MSVAETPPWITPSVVSDASAEFTRLAAAYGSTDRRNGTSRHDFGQQARQSASTVTRARQKGRLTWRHTLAERYWAVLAQPSGDLPELRALLVGLAAHALLWADALDRRITSQADRSLPSYRSSVTEVGPEGQGFAEEPQPQGQQMGAADLLRSIFRSGEYGDVGVLLRLAREVLAERDQLANGRAM